MVRIVSAAAVLIAIAGCDVVLGIERGAPLVHSGDDGSVGVGARGGTGGATGVGGAPNVVGGGGVGGEAGAGGATVPGGSILATLIVGGDSNETIATIVSNEDDTLWIAGSYQDEAPAALPGFLPAEQDDGYVLLLDADLVPQPAAIHVGGAGFRRSWILLRQVRHLRFPRFRSTSSCSMVRHTVASEAIASC